VLFVPVFWILRLNLRFLVNDFLMHDSSMTPEQSDLSYAMNQYTITPVLVICVFVGVLTASCQGDHASPINPNKTADILLAEAPVDRDYSDITRDGVLRMITYYSSNTYFLHRGVEMGFEYELVKAFAEEHDLALEVVIIGPSENPFDLLNRGVGDVIAANYAITPERREVVQFTRPYNMVNQILVFSAEMEEVPGALEEVAERGVEVAVHRNSSYFHRLSELTDEGLSLRVSPLQADEGTEAVLMRVASGDVEATVADHNMFDAANRYIDGLVPGPVVSEMDTISWAIRKNAEELELRMNQFMYKHFRFTEDPDRFRRSEFLNVIRKRYFEGSEEVMEYLNPEWNVDLMGRLSPYDDLLRSAADSSGLDWLLLTAIVAQESQFNPGAKSWAGAVGLMQVLPRFSELSEEELFVPEVNVREGVRILGEHLEHYAYMDSTNQWAFALATYNAGHGHVSDARRLAMDLNRNPNEWEDVSDALLRLMQRRYYQDARHGFARGIETVRYVSEIKNRVRTYRSVLTSADQRRY